MRLGILDHGHRLTQKLWFKLVGWYMGHVPGPMRTLTYRPSWFGSHFVDCLQEGLRESREWSQGEVELFAAFVSNLNRCEY